MSLIRWSPAREVTAFPRDIMNFQREMNRMFDGFFRGSNDEDLIPSVWSPAVDIAEFDNEYQVKVELPGITKEDVKISLEQNLLTVKGEKKQEKETKESNFHRVERSYGAFQRSFTLPSSVKGDKVDATFANGILTINMPKAEEAKPKQIEVKVK